MDEVNRIIDGREVLELRWSADGSRLAIVVGYPALAVPADAQPDTAMLWAQADGKRAVRTRRASKIELGERVGEQVTEFVDGGREVTLLFERVGEVLLPALPRWRP